MKITIENMTIGDQEAFSEAEAAEAAEKEGIDALSPENAKAMLKNLLLVMTEAELVELEKRLRAAAKEDFARAAALEAYANVKFGHSAKAAERDP